MTAPPVSTRTRLNPALGHLIAATLAVALLVWVGVRVTHRVSDRHADLRRQRALLADFAQLRTRFAPAAAAESIAWRRTWMELQDLGVTGDERLRMTQLVARAAESAGLHDVKVLIGPPDTTGSYRRLSTEEVQRAPASFGLLVEAHGSLRQVIAFLGHLPPSVAATRLSLVRQDGRARHQIALAVYQLEFTNGTPPSTLWSSVERGAARVGSDARPGG